MTIFHRRIVGIFVLGWMLVACAPGEATITSAPTLEELIDQADLIVRGHSVGSRTVWDGRRVVTEVDIALDELYKGQSFAPVSPITVQVEGGFTLQTPIPVSVTWPDQPRFSVDGEWLVFLRTTGAGQPLVVVGQGRGVFPIPPSLPQGSGDGPQTTNVGLLDQLRHILALRDSAGDTN